MSKNKPRGRSRAVLEDSDSDCAVARAMLRDCRSIYAEFRKTKIGVGV